MITRQFVTVPAGTIHCAMAGTGRSVLLLHQTPRSWDEFRDVLPLLGTEFRAIAMDTVGFGDSSRLPAGTDSIEKWAEAAISLLDALGIGQAAVVGHHTGAVVATELAAEYPDRVTAAVLSGAPLLDTAFRAAHPGPPPVDNAPPQADGSHLVALWSQRAPWYPPGNIDLMERYMVDALKAGPLMLEGHNVVARYDMEPKLPKIKCPVLIVAPTEDPHAFPFARPLAARIAGAKIVEVPGGRVPLPDQMPAQFARIVAEFLY